MGNRLPWPLKGSRSGDISLDTRLPAYRNLPGRLSVITALALVLAIATNALIALGLRLWHLDYLSIWLDEAHTALDSTLSARDLWLSALTDKPPLYYLITSAFWSPGGDEFNLRFPAALTGVLAVVVSSYLGKAIAGLKGAFALGLFFAVSMVNIRYSQEARQYILLALGWVLVTSSLYLFATSPDANRTEKRLRLATYCVGSLIMLHTHLIAIIYIALGLFSCFLVLVVSRRLAGATIVALGVCSLICFATLGPWLAAIYFRYAAGEDSFNWLANPGVAEAVSIYIRDAAGGRLTFALSAAGFAIYALRRNFHTSLFFLILAVAPPISLWLLGHVKPVYMGRIVMLGHVPVLVGLLLLACASERKWAYALTVALVSVVLVLPTARYFQNFAKEDWRGLASRIALAQDAGVPIFIQRISYYKPIIFYLPEDVPNVYFITENSAGETIAVDAKSGWQSKCLAFSCDRLAMKVADDPETVWYVARPSDKPGLATLSAFNSKLNQLTGKKYALNEAWAGHDVFLFKFRKKEYLVAIE